MRTVKPPATPAAGFLRHFARMIRRPDESADEARQRARKALPTVAKLAKDETEAARRLRLARAM